MRKMLLRVFLMSVVAIGLASCGDSGKETVRLIYVEWSSEIASTYVVKAVLEEKMGYEVEMTAVSAAAMWQGIGSGDADAMVAAWLDTTHGHYLEEVADKVENLGPNLIGTRVGLVVPTYVDIDSIPEMEANADKFSGKIIGIDPGAGLMSKTEVVLEEYNLDSFTLVEGTGATMTAALSDAIRNNEWIVVTGWTPHWKFAEWDLKYLEDPDLIYGEEEYIATIVRIGLKEDMPEVYAFLDNFNWTPEQMADLMIINNEDGADPEETASEWLAENEDLVNSWLND